jgi:hypothetical protein
MMKPDTHGTMTGTRCFGSPNTGRVPLSAIPTTRQTCQSTKDVLSDEEIIAVLSYIKSTWPDDVRARHDEMENRQ